jgi:hypothetical protein
MMIPDNQESKLQSPDIVELQDMALHIMVSTVTLQVEFVDVKDVFMRVRCVTQ